MNLREELEKHRLRHRLVYSTGGTINVVPLKEAERIASEYQRFMRLKMNQQLKELHLFDILNTLTPREKKILELKLLELNTYENIGKIFSVTRERIRQIEAKALDKLQLEANKNGQ